MSCEKDGESVGFEDELVRFGRCALRLFGGYSEHLEVD